MAGGVPLHDENSVSAFFDELPPNYAGPRGEMNRYARQRGKNLPDSGSPDQSYICLHLEDVTNSRTDGNIASMPQSITFYGAAETVTGSKHMLRFGKNQILIDCGLFQGRKELRERNWQQLGFQPQEIDTVVITHAHMDHIGYLPRLVAHGYQGPIYATPATIALARISLPDGGRLQEEDARFANKHGLSAHDPALPLYTEREAYECLKQFEPVRYGQFHPLPGGAQWRYLPAGHILGSAYAEVYFENGERILMSGDLGRFNTPIIRDPTLVDHAEYLVVESTYGDRLHPIEDPQIKLASIMNTAFEQGSAILVPSFAIGRTQELLYYLYNLQQANKIPRMPMFVDSPMATSTTAVYEKAAEEHDDEMKIELKEGHDPLQPAHLEFIRDSNQSKALNSQRGPMMIISGSGMANGGRIIHHLKHRLGDSSTIVLFTGYQADGTLGRRLIEGASTVVIHGQEIAVRARIEKLNALSAHADYGEIMKWLKNFKSAPRRTFIVHGEPPAQASLRDKIVGELGWDVTIPKQGETSTL